MVLVEDGWMPYENHRSLASILGLPEVDTLAKRHPLGQSQTAKPDSLWAESLVATFNVDRECPFYDHIYCANAVVVPDKKLSELFDIKEPGVGVEVTTSIYLNLNQEKERKSGAVLMTINGITQAFSFVSINSEEGFAREVTQQEIVGTEKSLPRSGTKKKDEAWKNYLLVIDTIRGIDKDCWKPADLCDDCHLKKVRKVLIQKEDLVDLSPSQVDGLPGTVV